MNWRQVNKKTVKCLITAFSFQPYFHTGRSKQAHMYHRDGTGPRASHKKSERRKGWDGRAQLHKVSPLLK